MTRRYTILLLMPHLGGGGAERVIAHLAHSLPSDRFAVHLGLITNTGPSADNFPSRVQLYRLNASRVLFGAVGLVRLVRMVQPDLILSGIFHLNFLVLLLKPFFPRATRILVRQNGQLSAWLPHRPRVGKLLYSLIYSRADGIVSQTPEMTGELRRCLGAKSRIHTLSNPVDADGIRRTANYALTTSSRPVPHLLAIGRLSPEKGFDLLLDAFAKVRVAYPTAGLTILGEGPERNALQERSAFLGLRSNVQFAGYVTNPYSWFSTATLLVVPSRYEALPNVLLEGAAAGLPIVATPCSAGVTELLQHQPGIWLAQQVSSASLAQSLNAALTTLKLGERFPHTWLAPFHLPQAVRAYESLILETLTAGASR